MVTHRVFLHLRGVRGSKLPQCHMPVVELPVGWEVVGGYRLRLIRTVVCPTCDVCYHFTGGRGVTAPYPFSAAMRRYGKSRRPKS